jgi:Fe2+ or Zn2+ uptake regulation protein
MAQNQRNTLQKKILWDTIQSMRNHPSAQEVYEEISKKNLCISRASVFRILNDLSLEGKIIRLRLPYGSDCYDYKTENHWHIQCKSCGQVCDTVEGQDNFTQKPKELNGFEITGFTITYEGICPRCQKKQKGE